MDFARTLDHVAGNFGRVIDWRRVRHCRHGGEAAGRRRAQSSRYGFLVRKAGITQMHVHVDKSGQHPETLAIERFDVVGEL